MKQIMIADKIKAYRRQHALTQAEFGQLLGVSAQAISKWERCECYPDITTLPDLAALLSCSVNDFFVER
jgi:DNA-binding XRE family transcriptional regulator